MNVLKIIGVLFLFFSVLSFEEPSKSIGAAPSESISTAESNCTFQKLYIICEQTFGCVAVANELGPNCTFSPQTWSLAFGEAACIDIEPFSLQNPQDFTIGTCWPWQ